MPASLRYLFGGVSLICVCLFLAACDAIDEDLSDCEKNFVVKYEVRLKTNLTTEIKTVLRDRLETAVADLLEDSLSKVFREYAHDVDLSFYVNDNLKYHDFHIMDAGQATYDLELPADNYRHLALANTLEEGNVDVMETETAERFFLKQYTGKATDGHSVGLFTARQNMNITQGANQTFDVPLYMANCASILVIRTDHVSYDDLWVYSGDFADGFMVNDSVYTHYTNPQVKDLKVAQPPANREVFYSVTFPSYDTAEEAQSDPVTRADIGSEDVQTGAADAERIWRKYVYVRLLNGTVTRTVINVRKPLEAGQVMIIYAYLKPDGSVYSPNVEVGTSVTLNWQDGLIFDN